MDDLRQLFNSANSKHRKKKQCLHYDAGETCNEVIKAHSIQKNIHLREIAEKGKVYMLSSDWSVLRKGNDRPGVDSIGIGKASTFQGFCHHHDNSTFTAIDDLPFQATEKQIGLNIYRSTCKEFHEQENAYNTYKEICEAPNFKSSPEFQFFGSHLAGVALALDRHLWHKQQIENAIKAEKFDEFKGLTIFIEGQQDHHFASATQPIFSFQGEPIQDLLDRESRLDVMYFFSAPTESGWAFCFGWHETSNPSCATLLNSFKDACRAGGVNGASDMLYRFLFASCDNHAFRISWWDGLTPEQRQNTLELVYEMVRSDKEYPNDFLSQGLTDIANWKITNVEMTNIEKEWHAPSE